MTRPPIGFAILGENKKRNQTQTGYSLAAVRLFGFADVTYKPAAIYIEFENVADPEDPVSVPEGFATGEGLEYYDGLSGDRDFVRVPILLPPYADIDPDTLSNQLNRLRWLAETTEVEGLGGLDFTSDANSKIYGLALVATPDWDDQSKDIILGRRYYEAEDQFVRPAVGGVRVGWSQTYPV